MIDCCELALQNGKLALYIALGAFAVISLLLAMFFGYNLKLDGRTAKLEKKNGSEQKQLDELKAQIQELKAKNHA
jgi:cell division protein FtsL